MKKALMTLILMLSIVGIAATPATAITADTVEDTSPTPVTDFLVEHTADSDLSPQECQIGGCDNPVPVPNLL